jgi:hypothetical protein
VRLDKLTSFPVLGSFAILVHLLLELQLVAPSLGLSLLSVTLILVLAPQGVDFVEHLLSLHETFNVLLGYQFLVASKSIFKHVPVPHECSGLYRAYGVAGRSQTFRHLFSFGLRDFAKMLEHLIASLFLQTVLSSVQIVLICERENIVSASLAISLLSRLLLFLFSDLPV